jgi:hypothetical protein
MEVKYNKMPEIIDLKKLEKLRKKMNTCVVIIAKTEIVKKND